MHATVLCALMRTCLKNKKIFLKMGYRVQVSEQKDWRESLHSVEECIIIYKNEYFG